MDDNIRGFVTAKPAADMVDREPLGVASLQMILKQRYIPDGQRGR